MDLLHGGVCVDPDDVLTARAAMNQHRVVGLLNLSELVEGLKSLAGLATGLDAREADLRFEVEEDRFNSSE